MKSAAMHTGNAYTRFISILCMVVGCYSQACFYMYEPIVTGFMVNFNVNGHYKFFDYYGGGQRYKNTKGMYLFKPQRSQSYVFAGSTITANQLGRTKSAASVYDAGNIPVDTLERFVNTRTGQNWWIMRLNVFDRNIVYSACNCNRGWTLSTDVCVQCVAGKYKSLVGNSACVDCPAFSTSSAASTACMCDPGYTGDGVATCGACGTGTYKPASGSAACLDCPAFSTALAASTALASCMCDVGYTGENATTCAACGAGTYKPASGSATCFDCPAFSTAVNASNALAACICNAGYSGENGGPCTACEDGKFKPPELPNS